MPSLPHEIPIDLLRDEPATVARVLREACGVALPEIVSARVLESDFTEVKPASWDADLVIELVAESGSFGVIVEVQLAVDPDKHFSWPLYAYSLAARRQGRVFLLVLAADEAVARWAARPIETVAGSTFRPMVVGPSQMPRLKTPEEVLSWPALAVLSAIAHGSEPDGEAYLRWVLPALFQIDDRKRYAYVDILAAMNSRAGELLEDLRMKSSVYQFPMSNFMRRHYGQGLEEAKAEAKAEGKAEGEAQALLTVLAARGLAVSDAVRSVILATTDLDQLQRWLTRAVTCTHADELLADPG